MAGRRRTRTDHLICHPAALPLRLVEMLQVRCLLDDNLTHQHHHFACTLSRPRRRHQARPADVPHAGHRRRAPLPSPGRSAPSTQRLPTRATSPIATTTSYAAVVCVGFRCWCTTSLVSASMAHTSAEGRRHLNAAADRASSDTKGVSRQTTIPGNPWKLSRIPLEIPKACFQLPKACFSQPSQGMFGSSRGMFPRRKGMFPKLKGIFESRQGMF